MSSTSQGEFRFRTIPVSQILAPSESSFMLTASEVDEILWSLSIPFKFSQDSGRWGVYILFSMFIPQCPATEKMEKEIPSTASSSSSDPVLADLFSDEIVDPVYQAKAHVLNQAIQKIGMGKYQVSCRINYPFWQVWNLFTSGISLRLQALVGSRTFFFQVPVYNPTLNIFACFSDSGAFVCPLSTYELGVGRL